MDRVTAAVQKAIAANDAEVEHGKRCYRLDALIRLGCLQGVATAAADTKGTDAAVIDARIGRNHVNHAVDIFRAEGRIVEHMGRTAAGTLEGSIGCNGDIAFFRKFLGIKACHLFLDAAIWMSHDDGRIFLSARLVVTCRRIDIRSYGVAIEGIADGVDVDLAVFILRNRPLINKAKGFLLGLLISFKGISTRLAPP